MKRIQAGNLCTICVNIHTAKLKSVTNGKSMNEMFYDLQKFQPGF